MILVFGSLNIDLVARVPVIPGPGRTALAPGYDRHFGGKGANQAVAAARMSRSGRAQMAGAVGDDAFGAQARANLEANGVDAALVATVAAPTGCAFIVVDAMGENAITVASGANRAARQDGVPDAALAGGVTLALQMETPWEQSAALAARVRKAGGRVVWNLAPAPAALDAATLRAILAATDVFIVNEHEAMDAARALGHAAGDFLAAASALARAGGVTCVVTAGGAGAWVAAPDGPPAHVPAAPAKVVDTTGAGDAFVGAFAAMIEEGRAPPEAARIACRAAARACETLGAQPGLPRRVELGLAD
jgi:ribokinase